MSEMVERVARALSECIGSPWPFDEMAPEVRALWMGHARCAIEAAQETLANPKNGVRVSRMLSDDGFMVSADVKMPPADMTPDKNGMYLLGFVLYDDELEAAKARAPK